MLIDASAWQRVCAEWGERWTLIPNGQGRFYVGSNRAAPGLSTPVEF
ncbi:MAG: hypothetical protein IT429_13560 [Gemmataceae bacterium]|nr:hypothetical protein [Gemmataceae bacterium]